MIDVLPVDGSGISARELAQKLEMDENLLGLYFGMIFWAVPALLTINSTPNACSGTNILRRARSRGLRPYGKLENLPGICCESQLQDDVSMPCIASRWVNEL